MDAVRPACPSPVPLLIRRGRKLAAQGRRHRHLAKSGGLCGGVHEDGHGAWRMVWELAGQACDGAGLMSAVSLVANLAPGKVATHVCDKHGPRVAMRPFLPGRIRRRAGRPRRARRP